MIGLSEELKKVPSKNAPFLQEMPRLLRKVVSTDRTLVAREELLDRKRRRVGLSVLLGTIV